MPITPPDFTATATYKNTYTSSGFNSPSMGVNMTTYEVNITPDNGSTIQSASVTAADINFTSNDQMRFTANKTTMGYSYAAYVPTDGQATVIFSDGSSVTHPIIFQQG